ncbi:hypothetical protein F5144DRAFT_499149 [Chaetomium tenue]|uniref:Uncharacterized protein n=1 Tax=Chaetomium tenue TaxID=1854479 RepID=A0ACB7P171_9PEZI|nr:hypothetical protein F5144DRAFT_499149 [Chaetomium globosum]
MLSLKTLVVTGLTTLTTLTTTTFAAPTTTPNTPATLLSKRADYQSSTDDDYCGEANPQYTYGSNTPLAADCKSLYEANAGPGYWSVSAAETRSLDSSADRWTRLAAQGSCAFEVRLSRENDGEGKAGLVEYRFGTNDVAFYIKSHAGSGAARDGRVGVSSGVWCRREKGEAQVRVDWRVVKA